MSQLTSEGDWSPADARRWKASASEPVELGPEEGGGRSPALISRLMPLGMHARMRSPQHTHLTEFYLGVHCCGALPCSLHPMG